MWQMDEKIIHNSIYEIEEGYQEYDWFIFDLNRYIDIG